MKDILIKIILLNICHHRLMQTIGLKMYQPWYNIKIIFRFSKYFSEYRESQKGINEFFRKVNTFFVNFVKIEIMFKFFFF